MLVADQAERLRKKRKRASDGDVRYTVCRAQEEPYWTTPKTTKAEGKLPVSLMPPSEEKMKKEVEAEAEATA